MSITGFNRRRRESAKKENSNKVEYSKLKVDELKEIAKEKEIEGFEEMKKAQLIEELEKLG